MPRPSATRVADNHSAEWPVIRTLDYNRMNGVARQIRHRLAWERSGVYLHFKAPFGNCAYVIDTSAGTLAFSYAGHAGWLNKVGDQTFQPTPIPYMAKELYEMAAHHFETVVIPYAADTLKG